MIKFYINEGNELVKVPYYTEGCWVNVVDPTESELAYLMNDLKIDADFVRSSFDEEESSRIENEGEQTLIIVDIPYIEQQSLGKAKFYSTMPIGIVITKTNIITMCVRNNPLIKAFASGQVKNIQVHLKTRFVLHLLLRAAKQYLWYLKQIDKSSASLEKELNKYMKNAIIMELLSLEKSLVYFSTSLKSNEITLEKILRGRIIKMYDEDEDLLEDVLIEVKQAIEMANIYSSILSRTMDAFSSVISNNLNIVMKILTCITILMQIPTIIFSLYGMNVDGLWFSSNIWVPMCIALSSTLIVTLILIKAKMFK